MTIQGKVVAITGASSGIGEATARHLASCGAVVVLGARRTDRLDQLVGEITAAGGAAAAVRADVTDPGDLQSLVDTAVKRFGRLDVLIGNAGITRIGRMDDLDVAGWSAMVDVNVKGILHGIAAALPVFRRQGSGHLVTVVSTSGLRTPNSLSVGVGASR
ncbi:SDR family oxidoreductase [Micromonospora sp. DT43]|uniref:SDR family oxidoreductase n=1 Tax=Micromonospora sp. DT43 TaxID=3393440 RepID=UPI003CE91D9E